MKIKMRRRDVMLYAAIGTLLGVGLVVLAVYGPQWLATPPPTEQTAAPTVPEAEARKIKARLFYVDGDGARLSGVEQDVIYGEGPLEQAKRLVEAQLAPASAPLVSAIPQGTRLKSVYLTKGGEAYVDLSLEFRANHPGGTMNEILTVYSLVNALTANLPAVTGVQILIDGREVDTLAGHVDLRRPLTRTSEWIEQPTPAAPAGN